MNNEFFRKNYGKWEKNRETKLFITKSKRNYLVSLPNYHTTKFFTEYLLAIKTTRFDTSNCELDIPLPKGKNKKIFGLMKDELVRKIMTKYDG